MTLSSMDGQYRGPLPMIFPPYRGERCIFSLIILCVSSLVKVIQQFWLGLSIFSQSKENGSISSSPSCTSNSSKSKELFLTLAGVPVFILPTWNPYSLSFFPSPNAAPSPSLPEGASYSPMNILPSMKVPVVRTTTLALIFHPLSVTTPTIRLTPSFSSMMKSTTVSIKRLSFSCFSHVSLASLE